MSHYDFTIPEKYSIVGDRLLIRTAYEEFFTPTGKTASQEANETNLRENAPSGTITRKIKLKMTRILSNWLSALELSPVASNGHKVNLPTFVTLTLPAKQFHTDKELNAKALNRFITQVKRSHEVTHYLWRAERQENGNIHYHVVIDKFIGWQAVRKYWNAIMNDLGYIDHYRNEQSQFHQFGFQVRKDMLQSWPEDSQRKAYNEGIESNWSNPNSTDIHALYKVKNVSSYISKYVTKADEFQKLLDLKKAYEDQQLSEDEYNVHKEIIQSEIDRKKINGRCWGCSDELRKLKNHELIECEDCFHLTDALIKDENTKVVTTENFTIIYNKKMQQYAASYPAVKASITFHQQRNFDFLYTSTDYFNHKYNRQPEEQSKLFNASTNGNSSSKKVLQLDLF